MPLQILHVVPPSVLKDEKLQQELNREGIIQFPFLDFEALSALNNLYETMHPTVPLGPVKGLYVSAHSSDLEYKLKIQNEIQKIIFPFCELYFKDYKCVTSVMQIKSASPESELGLHQDWTVVDESLFASYGLWIPLIDVSIENGALFALKRSHRIGPTYRHTALPLVYSNLGDVADKYLVPFEVKAGHAILFNQSLLHQSASNLSKRARPSIVSTIIPKDAEHIMFAPTNNQGNLAAWIIADDAVLRFNSFFEDSISVPTNAVKTNLSVTVDFTPVQPKEFERLYQSLL